MQQDQMAYLKRKRKNAGRPGVTLRGKILR